MINIPTFVLFVSFVVNNIFVFEVLTYRTRRSAARRLYELRSTFPGYMPVCLPFFISTEPLTIV